MYKNESINNLETLIRKYIANEDDLISLHKALKGIDKDLIATEYKLKRTIKDRQFTDSILNTTIEELKVKTEAIEKQKKLLEEQTKFKEKLFANVSHELRTPLHGIQGMNQLLSKTELDTTQHGYVEIIQNSADNLLVIINDLLTFSEINADKVDLKRQPFSMVKLCNELENILSVKAKKKGLNLLCMCPPTLPEYLVGDRVRLYQLFINLLNNALKFTHHGYIAMNVYPIEMVSEKVKVQFEIRDTGIGMKESQLDKIFSSFTRVHGDDGNVYEGAGLGLNIVKNLVNKMGGNIEVQSEVGKGTNFYVTLSFEVASEMEIATFKNNKSALTIPPHWKFKKLLLIEDNKANLLYAINIFLDWGIELTTAENLVEATEQLRKEKFDCILSDVKLPDGNGLAFIKELRATSTNKNQRTPVMVLTASSNEKEAKYAKGIEVQSYIGKPFKPDIIVQELTRLLDEPNEMIASVPPPKYTTENSEAYFSTLNRNFKEKNILKVEILNIFLDQIPGTLDALEKSLVSKDMEAFHFEAHNIKSTINNIGLPKLKPVINTIDEYCYKKINMDQLPRLFESFKQIVIEDIQIMLMEREKLMTAC